jgi:RND superfamily putative drug exporter
VHLTGLDALSASSGQKGGVGLLAEGLLGGLGALVVLGFVFASLLAFVPLLTAVVSIMTTFLVVWGLTAITSVSGMVAFLIALIGLGLAIDYSLLIIVRWREERAHGHDGEEAIVRAMATAGRAVVFSGTTVGIGLLGPASVPSQRRVCGVGDPVGQRRGRDHVAARRSVQVRSTTRLAAPALRRPRQPRLE